MALLFMDGFDSVDLSSKWDYVDHATVATSTYTDTTTRFGVGRLIYGNSAYNLDVYKNITASAAAYCGVAAAPESYATVELRGDAGATLHISAKIVKSEAKVYLYRGTTVIDSADIASSASWNYLEVGGTIHDTSGTAQVYINGVEVINFVGDTRNGGTNLTFDRVWLKCDSNSAFDDFYVCNDVGSTNNTFLGDVRVQTLVPNAAGANTDFTPTGGTNYANVADIPDDTGTYNTSSTVGHKDTYDFSDLVSGTGTVFGIQTNMHAKKADAGIGALKEIVVAGATTYDGNTTQLPTSTAWIGQIRETNPDTSAAWTVGDVNSLEAGAEVA